MAIYSKGHLQYPVTEFLCFIFRFATHKKLKDVFFFHHSTALLWTVFFLLKVSLSRPDFPASFPLPIVVFFLLRSPVIDSRNGPLLLPRIGGISSLLTFLAKRRSRRCPVLSVTLDPKPGPGRLLPLGGGGARKMTKNIFSAGPGTS